MSSEIKYPEAFLHHMKNVLGNEFDAFVQSLGESSPTSVRLNPFKPISKFNEEEKIPWCANGRYLKERPSFTFDPLFHAGAYYVQEASSMFIEQAWKQINPNNTPVRVLDMCAAPGGKSTHLLSLMSEESLLVSNEVIANRNNILQQNIVKWGTANCIVTQNKPEDFAALENFFDIILIDAPCSGEGLFRKDKNAIDEWSEQNVERCAVRQKNILQQAIACLKPGGFIIYSTCTFEEAENDRQMANEELPITNYQLSIKQPGVTLTNFGYQFFPHKIKGEGFYMAVMQKPDNGQQTTDNGRQTSNGKANNQLSIINNQYLNNSDNFITHTKNDLLFAIPKNIYSDFLFLQRLYIRHAGIFMGTMKGKDFLPSHDLALSNYIKTDLPAVDLNNDDAISYLRGETPKLKTDIRGLCLVKYENKNLGWIKAMEGRMNNYYPKELRILKR